MYEWLESIKIGLCLIFLSYASWQDYKTREISNTVWVLFAPLGFTLTLFQILLTQQNFLFRTLGISFIVVSGISVTLFYLGFFGGADAKAFICLSITLPFGPVLFKPPLTFISNLFSLSIFENAVLVSALTAVGLVIYNISWRIKTRERLFEGLSRESSWKKFIALITGYKVELSKIKKNLHIVPLEELSTGEDGKVTRHLKVFVQAYEDNEERTARINTFSEFQDVKIWVTPNLPFIIFITIGLLVTLLLGDIILWIATLLINF